MIKDAWDEADFYDVGRMFGEKLKEALDNIPWDGIKALFMKRITGLMKNICTMSNALLAYRKARRCKRLSLIHI